MVRVLTSSAVDRRFDQTKDYEVGFCCFSAKYSIKEKEKKRIGIILMCPSVVTCLFADCCFSELTLNFQLRVLVLYKADLIIMSLKINLFSP